MPQPLRIRRTNIDHRMMHVRRTPRPQFRHLHPSVFRKMRRHNLVGVFHLTLRRNLHRLRHRHDPVRRRNIPSLGPLSWRRRIVLVARRCASLGPCRKDRNLLIGQRRIVGKMPESRISKPRRHHLHPNLGHHPPSPQLALLIGDQWHRSYLSKPMTILAMALQNRKNIAVERGLRTSADRGCSIRMSLPSAATDNEHARQQCP